MPGKLTPVEEMERGAAIISMAVHAREDADEAQREALRETAAVGHFEYRKEGDPTVLMKGIFGAMGPDWNPPDAINGMLKKYGIDRETLGV